jgi:hypothetical protein
MNRGMADDEQREHRRREAAATKQRAIHVHQGARDSHERTAELMRNLDEHDRADAAEQRASRAAERAQIVQDRLDSEPAPDDP